MQSISQLTQSLKMLEQTIYHLNTHIEPFILSDSLPEGIETLYHFYDLDELIESTTQTIELLDQSLSPLITLLNTSLKKRKSKSSMEPYASFIIDGPPVIKKTIRQLSFDDLIQTMEEKPKPIQRRKPLDYEGDCIKCGAPNGYVYKHTSNQFKCTICTSTFTLKPTYHDEIVHRCPHCEQKLMLQHERKHYETLLCQNDHCPFYLENKRALKQGDLSKLKTLNHNIKLRYTFRLFNFDLEDIKHELPLHIDSKIDLANIHHSKHTLGLILTYYINYGLSSACLKCL